MEPVTAFEWRRILIGDETDLLYLLEVVLRTAVMYGAAVLFARIIGKRGTAQITPFEFILIIVISSAAGDPMFYPNVPLLHGILVLLVIMTLHRSLGWLTTRVETVEHLMESEPLLVVEHGRVLEDELRTGTLSREELMSELRLQGIKALGEIERAFIEPSGHVSILRADDERPFAGESTLPRTESHEVRV